MVFFFFCFVFFELFVSDVFFFGPDFDDISWGVPETPSVTVGVGSSFLGFHSMHPPQCHPHLP